MSALEICLASLFAVSTLAALVQTYRLSRCREAKEKLETSLTTAQERISRCKEQSAKLNMHANKLIREKAELQQRMDSLNNMKIRDFTHQREYA